MDKKLIKGKVVLRSSLSAVFTDGKNGKKKDLGVIARKMVTTAGVNFLTDAFHTSTILPSDFKHHATGTGIVAEAIGDTALGAEVGSRVAGTQGEQAGAANIYETVAIIDYAATNNITEHGVFSALTVGTLWDRSVFAAIPVVAGDSIQWTYRLESVAGG